MLVKKRDERVETFQYSKGEIASYKPYSFVDGEGVRCSLYMRDCLFACEGCYNVKAQNFNTRIFYTEELEEQIIPDIGASYCQELMLLGSEPFFEYSSMSISCS